MCMTIFKKWKMKMKSLLEYMRGREMEASRTILVWVTS